MRVKKLNRRDKRLAAQIVREHKPIRTYKKREPGEEKTVSTVTKESYLKRHEFCLNARDIQRELERTPGAKEYFERHPDEFKPACNHPEDGLCVHRQPTEEELGQINERLGNRWDLPGEGKNLENVDKESRPRRRRRSEKEPPTYYCLKCEEWHPMTKEDHLKFKRGRGRPKKQ